LLLFSRKEILQLRDLDLNQSINDMTKMLRRTIGEDIQMQFKFAMQPLYIHADAGMMDQVLMNLTVNSRDAMPKGGRLIIETSAVEFDESILGQSAHARPGSFVCLSVSDTGCGIPAENLPRIFEPFFTTKEPGKGTGLGLATVYGIVKQHQGWVVVESQLGQGTTFTLFLPSGVKPAQAVPPAQPGAPALANSAMSLGDETILVVEDEPALRELVVNVLELCGYRILQACTGVEALKVWEKHKNEIDLLLTDMVMPEGISGRQLAERLQAEDPALKVIYTSGYSPGMAGKDIALLEGFNFLAKPYPPSRLANVVRECLDGKRKG
jgi:CheY-like chemotaxis protein